MDPKLVTDRLIPRVFKKLTYLSTGCMLGNGSEPMRSKYVREEDQLKGPGDSDVTEERMKSDRGRG